MFDDRYGKNSLHRADQAAFTHQNELPTWYMSTSLGLLNLDLSNAKDMERLAVYLSYRPV